MTATTPTTPTTRERIVRAAVEMTAAEGWSALTMGRLADRVGVSRQTVYNETGSKRQLADAVVLDELGRFLDVVDRAFDRHGRDVRAALETGVAGILALAGSSPVLRAVLAPGAGEDLLPALTTDGQAVLLAASARLDERLDAAGVAAGPRRDTAVDVLVRTVLSHVVTPAGDPASVAAGLADLVHPALTSTGPAPRRGQAR